MVHELATNAIKYGALSKASGTLDVSSLMMAKSLSPGRSRGCPFAGGGGFGNRLVTRSISSQLGGSIAFDWRTEGVVVTLQTSNARLEHDRLRILEIRQSLKAAGPARGGPHLAVLR